MEGVLEGISSAAGRGKALGKTAWSITVAGQVFGAGFRQPEANVGDRIRFDVVADGKFQNAYRIERVLGSARAPQAPAPAQSPAGSAAPRPLAAPAPSAPAPITGPAPPITTLSAALIVCTFAKLTEPGWSLDDYVARVADVAEKLGR